MSLAAPRWVLEAAALPVAFAQVREDALLDLWVVEQLPQAARVLLIASGGCTGALLATAQDVRLLHLVDPNAAQIALARLKFHLLRHADPGQRLAVLGHVAMDTDKRRSVLAEGLRALNLPEDSLGPIDLVAHVGPDHAGRYEYVFKALRERLRERAAELKALLELEDPAEQVRRVDPSTALGRQLDEGLDAIMALPNLVHLFGNDATNNPVEPFSRHFARRIRHVVATLPANRNPYLWQMLLGCYPPGSKAPWLECNRAERTPLLKWSKAYVDTALETASGEYDFVHLSNVLDWLAPERAARTLRLAHAALRPGGWMLLRQLNSTLDIPRLGPMFEWHEREAGELHARDRSFFYRAMHLGRKT